MQRGQHVGRGRVTVRVLAPGECARRLALRPAEHVGEQFEERVGRGSERHLVGKDLPERAAPDARAG